jgi:hypothetical protein
MRLQESFPGQFEFRFKFDPGAERLILVPTYPVRWLHYVSSVQWHVKNLEFKNSHEQVHAYSCSMRVTAASFTRRRAS